MRLFRRIVDRVAFMLTAEGERWMIPQMLRLRSLPYSRPIDADPYAFTPLAVFEDDLCGLRAAQLDRPIRITLAATDTWCSRTSN